MSNDRSEPTVAQQGDESRTKPESSTIATSGSASYPASEAIRIPDGMAELWLQWAPEDLPGPVMNEKIIAVRRLGPKRNYLYLLEVAEEWFWPQRVAKDAKDTWKTQKNVASMKGQNLDIQSSLREYDLFLIRIDSAKVNPLHADLGVVDRNWAEIGEVRHFISLARKDKNTEEGKTPSAAKGQSSKTKKSKSSASSAPQETASNSFIAVHMRAARRPSWWSAKHEKAYSFYEQKHYDNAQDHGLRTPYIVLDTVGFASTYPMEYIGILLRFVQDIDPLSPVSEPRNEHEPWHRDFCPSEAHERRPVINPTKTFKVQWEQLKDMSVKSLLAIPQQDREEIVSLIVSQAPHALHNDSWVLLLVLTIGTEEYIERCLKSADIKVESGWYERSCQKLLLQLKQSSKGELTLVEDSDVYTAWKRLKQGIHRSDVYPEWLEEDTDQWSDGNIFGTEMEPEPKTTESRSSDIDFDTA
ncbi:hypothetical protein BKA58DRAFT_400780 [Alternaria rosae]|uniref:uncharacterized protein n=1 Tax=Alternaria rosae TaxID=1187941 RepID=UPI001E8DDFAD|nr:uncharacterized protein BKA58DRAFT_400780 [Alternaria rosae]KAH6872558.1 hypothetical protein BKA58DRAFT_400780 [Alternaria rosae]